MGEQFEFFKYDGGYYRRPMNDPGIGVREVLSPGKGWVPFDEDDALKPAMFGSKIEEADLPKQAAEQAEA